MSSTKEAKCPKNEEEEINQTGSDEEEINFILLPNLKCEDEDNDTKSRPVSGLDNVDAGFSHYFIKTEPEDIQFYIEYQPQAENVALKEELDCDMEDHKPGWEPERSSTAGIKNEPEQCDSVQKHESRSSESESEEKMKYNCAHCTYKTNNKYYYIQHYNCKHAKAAEVFRCEECAFESRRKGSFAQHYRSKHAKNAKVYKCQECSYGTKRRGDLSSHYKYRHAKESEVFKCEECSFQSRYKSSVTKHYKIIHTNEAEVYRCEWCPYETKIKSHSNRHNKQHLRKAKVYRCQECSFETRHKGSATKHFKLKRCKRN